MNLLKLLVSFLSLRFTMSKDVRAMGFYGLETEQRRLVCSDVNPPAYYFSRLRDLGFNTIRLPFSTIYTEEGDWEKMDEALQLSYQYNFSVILDHHRTFPDKQDHSPLDRGMTMERFMNSWFRVLERYSLYTNIIGLNAWNEYAGDNATFINEFNANVFTQVENKYPNRYRYWVTGILWSGKLVNVNIDYLPFKDRINYSLHKYVFSIGAGQDYETSWEESLGGHPVDRVIIGEYGWLDQDAWWGELFISWLKKKGITDTAFWTIARSDGTGGLWEDDCITFEWEKYHLLRSLWGYSRRLRFR